jgi:hypothetical protein
VIAARIDVIPFEFFGHVLFVYEYGTSDGVELIGLRLPVDRTHGKERLIHGAQL